MVLLAAKCRERMPSKELKAFAFYRHAAWEANKAFLRGDPNKKRIVGTVGHTHRSKIPQ